MASTRANVPLRLQLYRQLRAAIEAGSLTAGSRLPPTREHALGLGVSRNTLLWAMARLQAEGYVTARVGDGSYVAAGLARSHSPATGPLQPQPVLSRRGQSIAETHARWQPPLVAALPFRIGAPEVASFPYALWDRLARQIDPRERQRLAQYLDPAGHAPLREAVAQWLWVARGVRCDAGQVLVCSGSQQALDLIARLLLDPGDEVLVEDPGYPGIRAALLGQGAQVRPVPIDREGLCIASGAERWPAARLAVVTPTHQFPVGVRMSLARRRELLDWAERQDAWVVEDDYDGEFQYGPHRLEALTSLPQAGRVLYVGTFSKILHPGLRLGFIVLPAPLLRPFAAARAVCDRHAPGDSQAVLARFIADGHLLRHLNRMRELYPRRQQHLIQALADASDGRLQLAPSAQGLHLLHELPGQGARRGPHDDEQLSQQALAAGVMLTPLSRYAMSSPRRGWLFGYAGYDEAALTRAAQRLAPLLGQLTAPR